jgi:hypothetical protein
MDLHRLRLLGSLHKAKNHHQHRVLKLTIEPLRNGPDPAQIREPRQQPGKGRSGIKSLVASGSKSERSNSRLPSLCCVGWTMLHPSRSRPTASTGQATCHLPYVALHDPRFGVSLHCAHADPFHNLIGCSHTLNSEVLFGHGGRLILRRYLCKGMSKT